MLVVHQLAGVLLDMDALDTDAFAAGIGVLFIEADVDRALTDQRMIELADLITLRQIGIEVILAVEARPFVDLRIDRHARANRLADALTIGHRQHAGHRRVDQRHLCVRLGAKRRRRAREKLGVRSDLGMDFKADHDLPLAGGTLDAIVAHFRFR